MQVGGKKELGAFPPLLTLAALQGGEFSSIRRGEYFSGRADSGWGLDLAQLSSRAARMPRARQVHTCGSLHVNTGPGPVQGINIY